VKSNYYLRHVCLYAQNNSAPTGWFFTKFDMREFLENPWRIFKLDYNMSRKRVLHMRTNAQLRQYLNEFFLRDFVSTNVVEKLKKTHFKFSNFSPTIVPFMS